MVTLVNRAKMSTSTTGTGTITLGSAESGYQSFADAGVSDGDVVRYAIEDGDDWEIGSGTYTATGTTLSRTVDESSNSDAALNLTGSAVVFITAAAEDVFQGELFAESYDGTSTKPNASGTNTIAIGVNAYAPNENSIAIGRNSSTQGGSSAIAFGDGADARSSSATALGYNTYASGFRSTAIGVNGAGGGSQAIGSGVTTGKAAMALGGSYASGVDSLAAAIANNTSTYGATGANSVAIGQQNKVTGTASLAIGGKYNQATNFYSVCVGSNGGQATAVYSATIGGYAPIANKSGQVAFGTAFASGWTTAPQTSLMTIFAQTADATPTELLAQNVRLTLPDNSAYAFHGTIVARQQASAGTASAAWKVEGLIRREGSAGTTVLVNSATTVLDNTPGWGMALSADTTNGGLKIEVTGAAATNIRWVATINTSEVTY